jgi:hypothetical protein
MRKDWKRAVLFAALLLLIVVAGAIAVRDVRAPEHDVVVVRTPAAATADAAFRAGFLPLVERTAAEARVLVAMGEDRERNLLRIRRQQAVMLESLAAADAWLEANPPPPALVPAAGAYHDGAHAIRVAMGEAHAGLLRLDFDRVARATDTLADGSSALDLAAMRLRIPDPGTPSS